MAIHPGPAPTLPRQLSPHQQALGTSVVREFVLWQLTPHAPSLHQEGPRRSRECKGKAGAWWPAQQLSNDIWNTVHT